MFAPSHWQGFLSDFWSAGKPFYPKLYLGDSARPDRQFILEDLSMANVRTEGAKTTSIQPSSKKEKAKSKNSIELISFAKAVSLSEGCGNRHLLLGNGFSIALFPKIFTYNTLLESAKASGKLSSEIGKAFEKLETTDFERVMESLEAAATLVEQYEKSNPKLAKKLREDAALLREILAETIALNHPERPNRISDDQYASCRRFLANFNGHIYTLNYDLLLYWTLMHSAIAPAVKSDDGFRNSDNDKAEYVTWEVENTVEQRIHYLHGALHIYDAGAELLKFTWSKTNIALVDQIRESLNKRHYPLVVTEGTSNQKKDRIQHSNFLGRSYRSFSAIQGCLFVYGHSLAENDEHLLRLVDHGKVKKVFVGIYGKASDERNQQIIERAQLFATRRKSGTVPEVHFFDAESAQVWDSPDPETSGSTLTSKRPK
jgi:hypothetical protein